MAAILYRTAQTYFTNTHPTYHGGLPSPIGIQITFARRCRTGPAWLEIEEVKLGARTSIIRIILSQAQQNTSSKITKLIGSITVSNISTETGLSTMGNWLPINSSSIEPPFDGTDDSSLKGSRWRLMKIPFPKFRKAPAHVEVYIPAGASISGGDGTYHHWARLRWIENGDIVQGRWSQEAATFMLDVFPVWLARLEQEVSARVEQPAPIWFPTLSMSIHFKKAIPSGGVDWLFSQVTSKCIRNGRMDIEVVILDELGDIVALASHEALIVSASRNSTRL